MGFRDSESKILRAIFSRGGGNFKSFPPPLNYIINSGLTI